MPLTPGTRLGPYEVLARIGAGGMGEVYRAKDTKLDREVAIKVLPAAVAQDTDRLLRFEREAKVVASLNHPNIAHIYGVEEKGETRALVMELVAGATLSVPQPLDTSLHYARQIAEALEAAHDRGITHRDLKPANIMVTPEGVVKVLDFGLATVPSRDSGSDPANSPTFTMAATQVGMIMGTASYMSPEQAAGKAVDRRSDIWSFGVVLWEMLTGARLFEGETISHTLADVLRAPIEFGKLPASTPPPIAELVKRCLDRNVKTRLQAIGEARIAIQKYYEDAKSGAADPSQVGARPAKFAWAPWVMAAAVGVVAAGLSVVAYRHTQEPPPKALTASVLPPEKNNFVNNSLPALSPDGRKLAFAAMQEGKALLWIRDLNSLAARSISGTEGAVDPFWSPDSQSVGFFAAGKVKRVDVGTGTLVTLCATEGNAYGASWSTRGVIVFPISATGALYRVAETGGEAVPVTTLDQKAGEVSHRLAWFLPDGRHFLYSVRNQDQLAKSALYVGDLDSKERSVVLKGEVHAAFVAAGEFLVFTSAGMLDTALLAQRFDLSTLRTTGASFPIVESVDLASGVWAQHQFSVSREGTLAYASSGAANKAQLTWVDRTGKVLGTVGLPDSGLRTVSLSPDDHTVAGDRLQSGSRDIWLHDVARGASSRFTFNLPSTTSFSPSWSPDGTSLLYVYTEGSRPATVMRKAIASGGIAEEVGSPWGDPPRAVNFATCSRDGRYLVARLNPNGPTGADLWMKSLNTPGEKPRPYLQSKSNEFGPSFGPSSDWLAYVTDETRRFEVYVQSFPTPGRKYQVSVNGGTNPVWSRDGKELFFIAPDRQMMVAAVHKNGGNLEFGTPKALFDAKLVAGNNNTSFDVTKDGRFLIPVQEQGGGFPLTLVVNWQAGLKK